MQNWKYHELTVTLSLVFADEVAVQGSEAVVPLAGTDTSGAEPSGRSTACATSDRSPFISSTCSTK
jgi:hypothetical protein